MAGKKSGEKVYSSEKESITSINWKTNCFLTNVFVHEAKKSSLWSCLLEGHYSKNLVVCPDATFQP